MTRTNETAQTPKPQTPKPQTLTEVLAQAYLHFSRLAEHTAEEAGVPVRVGIDPGSDTLPPALTLACEDRRLRLVVDPGSYGSTRQDGFEGGPLLVSREGVCNAQYRSSANSLISGLLPMDDVTDQAGTPAAFLAAGAHVYEHRGYALRFNGEGYFTPIRLEFPDGRFLLGAHMNSRSMWFLRGTTVQVTWTPAGSEEHLIARMTDEERAQYEVDLPDLRRFLERHHPAETRTVLALLNDPDLTDGRASVLSSGRRAVVPGTFTGWREITLSAEQEQEVLERLRHGHAADHTWQRENAALHPSRTPGDERPGDERPF